MREKLRIIAIAAVVVCAYWNIVNFGMQTDRDVPPRDSNDAYILERRLSAIRVMLHAYPAGQINFLSNRDLQGQKRTGDDDNNWMRASYVLLPWKVKRNEPARFIIVDFHNETPAPVPEDFSKLYDSGDGLVLFEKRQLP